MKQCIRLMWALVLLASFQSQAQNSEFISFSWEDASKIKPREAKHPESSAENLLDERFTEYTYNSAGELECYNLHHVMVRVNTDKGIERFNKLYVGVSGVIRLIQLRGRSISPAGVVKEISESDIKEITDDEDGDKYRIFAFEGIEKGSLVEYYFVSQDEYQLYGRESFQNDLPTEKARFQLISPENLVFKSKTYNAFPAVTDTLIGSKRYIQTGYFSLKPIFEEKYSNMRANVARIEYRLAYNTSRGKAPIYTYAEASKNIYNNLYRPQDKPSRALEKALKGLKLNDLTPEEKAARIETNFKSNVVIREEAGGKTIDAMIKDKAANEGGMTDLLLHALEMEGIKTEVVLTSNRYNVLFDEQFESYGFFSKYLIYLPEFNKYISPADFQYRLGTTPLNYIGNNGLFIRSVDIGGVKMGIGSIKKIQPPPLDDSYEYITADVSFDLNNDMVNIRYKKELMGYLAAFYKPYYELLTKENQDKLTEDLLKAISADTKLSDIKVSNTDMYDVQNKNPFTLEANLAIPSVMEKAGNKYLFKVGELIGPQTEMYQEKERQTDVELEYMHRYKRIIRFKAPEGYVVQGLEKVQIKQTLESDGKVSSAFISNYTTDADGTITITAEEFYGELRYPMSRFNDYKNVINAAADFNKIVVVFVKK